LIKSDKTSTKINIYPSDEFPGIPRSEGEMGSFDITSDQLDEGIRSVWLSASTSNIKPELSSVHLYDRDNMLFFVATDFFRLSEKKINTRSELKDISILLPYKNTQNIIRLIDGKEKIKFLIDENQVSLMTKNTLVTSRTINGSFPDYIQIIPKKFNSKATILKEDLSAALKVNSIFSGEFNQIKFIVSKKSKKLKVETNNAHIGTNVTEIDSDIEGDDMEITFNHKYISDCLPYFNSESITLGFEGLNKPLLIKGVSDDSLCQLIMPMNK